jgi:hypothetical protein
MLKIPPGMDHVDFSIDAKYRRTKAFLFYFFLPWSSWRLAADFGCLAFAWDAVIAHCVCPSQREVVPDSLCFGKRIYHANPALDSDDGFDLMAKKSLSVLRESVGRF